jgi:hypothetical protein
MARTNIVERTEDEIIVQYTDRFFRRVFASTPAIPAAYDGKYAVMCALAVDIEASEAQMDAMETQIEAIANVHKAFVMVGPARIPLDRVPADHDLTIGVEASFNITPMPAE